MRTLVIGDLHGNYKGLMQALERSKYDDSSDILISLGDLVDGHSDSYEVIEELSKMKNLLLVQGNHDEWFKKFIKTGIHGSSWQQGAKATGISYLNKSRPGQSWYTIVNNSSVESIKQSDIPQHHIDLLNKQVPYIKDSDNNLFIHGGFNRHWPLSEQLQYTFWWDRDLWNSALSFESMVKGELEEKPKFKIVENFKEIFIGHTSTQSWGEDKPMHAANIWNVDTGGGWNGKITIMDVDTKEFWQSDNGNILYPDFKGRE